jgi:regulatory protein
MPKIGPSGPATGGGAADTDPLSLAREICLRQLAVRARSRTELATTLRRRGVTEETAREVLDRLTAVGLIDDDAFAAALVSSARVNRGLGRRALAAELRRRGIDPDISDTALQAVSADEEEASARDLVIRRLRSLGHLPEQVQARRCAAMLTRKGYPADLAFRVVGEVLKAGEDSWFNGGAVTEGDI